MKLSLISSLQSSPSSNLKICIIFEGYLTYSIKAEKCWEVWCFKVVQHVNKLCAVYSIAGCEHTSGKHTKLKKLCDGFTFGRFWNTEINRQITLSNSPVQKLQRESGVQASAATISGIVWVSAYLSKSDGMHNLLAGSHESLSCFNDAITLWLCSSCCFNSSFNFSNKREHLSFSFFFLLTGWKTKWL